MSEVDEDPVAREISGVVRDWHVELMKLYKNRDIPKFKHIRELMMQLIKNRRQILGDFLPLDHLNDLKNRTTAKIDQGNRELGLDMMPRDLLTGEVISATSIKKAGDGTGHKYSIIELHKVHEQQAMRGTRQMLGIGAGRASVPLDSGKQKAQTQHLYFQHKTFAANIGEETVVTYTLYDAGESQAFVSESYIVRLSKQGQPVDSSTINKMMCCFTEIKASPRGALYLVAVVNRIGQIDKSGGTKLPLGSTMRTGALRRPEAVGVVPLQEFVENAEGDAAVEFTLQLYKSEEDVFAELYRYIIRGESDRYQPLERGGGNILISCRLLSGEFAQVRKKNPTLLRKETAIAQRMGFAEIIKPEELRNDLYVTIDQAVFNRGEKKAVRNIEVTMKVVDEKMKTVEGAIVPGATVAGHRWPPYWTSMIYYANNIPKWIETVKIKLEPDQFAKCHLKFTFKHCSSTDKHEKKDVVFAYTYKRLVDPTTATLLKDELHSLPVYKWTTKSDKNYLDPKNGATKTQETFNIKTLSCSTRITQEPMLLNLLRWEANPAMLDEILAKVKQLKGTEIIKHFRTFFDALFKILDTKETKDKYSRKVFDVLVYVCAELSQPKYYNYRSEMDKYVSKHMSSKSSFQYLISNLQEACDTRSRSEDPEDVKVVRKMMEALQFIFQFAYQSRKLFNKAFKVKSETDTGFRDKVSKLLKSFSAFIADPAPALFSLQQSCVRYFSTIFAGLSAFFSPSEISDFATEFLHAIPEGSEGTASFATAKIKFLDSIVRSDLFKTHEGRKCVLPSVLSCLQVAIGNKSHFSHALSVVCNMLTHFEAGSTEEQRHGDVLSTAKCLLRPLFEQCADEVAATEKTRSGSTMGMPNERRSAMSKEKGSDGKFFPCLLGLLRQMIPKHYTEYVAGMTKPELVEFMNLTLETFISLVTKDIFSKDWMVMVMLTNDVLLKAIAGVSPILDEHFSQGDSFDQGILETYFQLLALYIGQDCLALQDFTETKRQNILNAGPDRRVEMASVMAKQFGKIASADKFKFIKEVKEGHTRKLLGSIQQAALTPSDDVRDLLIPMFFDLIDSEIRHSGNISIIERDLIVELDQCVSEGQGDKYYRFKYQKIMKQLSEQSDHGSVIVNGKDFASAMKSFNEAVDNLLTQLLALRNVPEGSNYNDMRAGYMYELLKFYEQNEHPNLQFKYIYRLCDLHEATESYAEAGFTLKLHASLLNFTDKELKGEVDQGKSRYPAQKERQRKEQVYSKMVDYFDKGLAWENAIDFAKELAAEYERTMDYSKLCSMYRKLADLFEKISTGKRTIPQYFKVGYYGMPFPHGFRNVTYVYRSKDKNTHIKDFCDKVQNQFPTAQIKMKDIDPTDEMRLSPEMQIMISKITPVVDEEAIKRRYGDRKVTDAVRAYYDHNEVSGFKYARPYREGPKTDNEFVNLWTANYTLTTEAMMPSMLARSAVLSLDRINVDPIQNAINAMNQKNVQLQEEIEAKSDNPGMSINPLTMALNGVLDAAVMGGTDMYRKAFFSDEYMDAHPDMILKAEKLSTLMDAQVEILDLGVMIHGKYCPKDLKPLQKRLETILNTMKGKSSSGTLSRRASNTSVKSALSMQSVDSSGNSLAAGVLAGTKKGGSGTNVGKSRGSSMKVPARVQNDKNPFGAGKKPPSPSAVAGTLTPRLSISKANVMNNVMNPFPEDDGPAPLASNAGPAVTANPHNPFPSSDDDDEDEEPVPKTPNEPKELDANPFSAPDGDSSGADRPADVAPAVLAKTRVAAPPPPIPAKDKKVPPPNPALSTPSADGSKRKKKPAHGKANPFGGATAPPPIVPKTVKPPERPRSKKPSLPGPGAKPSIPKKAKPAGAKKNPFADAKPHAKKNPFAS